MARPHKALVDYFPHYVNHGKTMFTIESKYGNDGYAFWYKLLELLGSSEHHYIDCNDPATWEFLLAKTRISEITANDILNTCVKLGAIDKELWELKIIRSGNFIENLDDVYKRRNIDVINKDDIICLCKQKYPVSGVIVDINPQSKLKETKEEKSIVTTQNFYKSELEKSNGNVGYKNLVQFLYGKSEYNKEKCSNVLGLKDQLTYDQFQDMMKLYNSLPEMKPLRDIVLNMENKKDLQSKYKSFYRTLCSWVKIEGKQK